ncbi:hypothetical protein ENH_00022290 [Eimeria necatrix]|uniref:Secreted protein n=1 Tax=Eimeria necatrix TaxID=51315 RepID=U6MU35_9EIME|nr:hypothetical protein ENH_00022290 [Eimeria necatrix]CDJ66568.1 hypothetical protein ENH_00022290 [Eimeria necatrix]
MRVLASSLIVLIIEALCAAGKRWSGPLGCSRVSGGAAACSWSPGPRVLQQGVEDRSRALSVGFPSLSSGALIGFICKIGEREGRELVRGRGRVSCCGSSGRSSSRSSRVLLLRGFAGACGGVH